MEMMYMPGGDDYTPNPGPKIENKLLPLLQQLIEANRGKSLEEFNKCF